MKTMVAGAALIFVAVSSSAFAAPEEAGTAAGAQAEQSLLARRPLWVSVHLARWSGSALPLLAVVTVQIPVQQPRPRRAPLVDGCPTPSDC